MTEDLIYEVKAGIGRITFNRPHARNAFTFAMYEGVADICSSVPDDGSVKVILMTGAGDKAFGAGTDISQFRVFETREDALGYEHRIDRVMTRIEDCPVPTIAAIAGACTGGGAGIAAACDLRICAKGAKFGFPIARTLGNCLSAATLTRLSWLIGPAATKELIFTARLLEAEEAKAAGLVSEVLENHAALMDRADALSRHLAEHAPLTMRSTKMGLKRLRDAASRIDDEDLILMCYMSEDFREGMDAFLTKRKPVWKGR